MLEIRRLIERKDRSLPRDPPTATGPTHVAISFLYFHIHFLSLSFDGENQATTRRPNTTLPPPCPREAASASSPAAAAAALVTRSRRRRRSVHRRRRLVHP
jgi:hypothetical protein